MASTRLRHAFKYPEDSSSSEPEDLDEEHQERLIASLRTEDFAKTNLYRTLFLLLPLSGALFSAYTFCFHARTPQQRLLALLALSSEACTAYILHYLPITAPERKGKVPVYQLEAAKGPVERYIVYLNAGLAGLLMLAAGVYWSRGAYEEAWREALPMIMFGLTMIARQQLAPLDLEELQKAKYDYKGA